MSNYKPYLYIQCDARFCEYLEKKILEKTALEIQIERIQFLENLFEEIFVILNDCEENRRIARIFPNSFSVIWVVNEDVNKRFLHAMQYCTNGWLIRVCADQCLLDIQFTEKIIDLIRSNGNEYDYFYEEGVLRATIPDCININNVLPLFRDRDEPYCENVYTYLKNNAAFKPIQIAIPFCTVNARVNSSEGYRLCKNILENNIDIEKISKKMIANCTSNESTLMNTGLWNSWFYGASKTDEFFFDSSGMVNPWWVTSAIEFIKGKLNKNMRIFEWGSGNSTIFWENYCESVTAVEHEVDWYEKMKKIVKETTTLIYKELIYDGDYSKAILDMDGEFEIILIDGRDRVNCIHNSLKKLTNDGIIILDNAERIEYMPGIQELVDNKFKKLDFKGELYGLANYDITSIFYRDINVFDI